MDIFGRHIFGSDAQYFINLCFEEQVKYIEKYTNQRDKEQIRQFLSNLVIGKDECLDCKQKRESYGNIVSEAVPTEVANDSQQTVSRGVDVGDNPKRHTVKKRKDKGVH
jgi:hypothetical protein